MVDAADPEATAGYGSITVLAGVWYEPAEPPLKHEGHSLQSTASAAEAAATVPHPTSAWAGAAAEPATVPPTTLPILADGNAAGPAVQPTFAHPAPKIASPGHCPACPPLGKHVAHSCSRAGQRGGPTSRTGPLGPKRGGINVGRAPKAQAIRRPSDRKRVRTKLRPGKTALAMIVATDRDTQSGGDDPAQPVLHVEWEPRTTPGGQQQYFWNPTTNAVMWERPIAMATAPSRLGKTADMARVYAAKLAPPRAPTAKLPAGETRVLVPSDATSASFWQRHPFSAPAPDGGPSALELERYRLLEKIEAGRSQRKSVKRKRRAILSSIKAQPLPCCVCGLDDDNDGGAEALLCDGCDLCYHLHCLDPPLAKVPDENWYCTLCPASLAAAAAGGASVAATAGTVAAADIVGSLVEGPLLSPTPIDPLLAASGDSAYHPASESVPPNGPATMFTAEHAVSIDPPTTTEPSPVTAEPAVPAKAQIMTQSKETWKQALTQQWAEGDVVHEHTYGAETYDAVTDEYSKTCSSCSHVRTYEKM